MKRAWSIAAGLLLGGTLLFFAVRQVDWHAVMSAVAGVSPAWLLLAMLATATAQVLFAARWYVLAGSAHGLSFAKAFDFLAIGALSGLVLPSRLSDLVRAVAAGRFHGTSATGLFGTIVVERVLDVFMLVVFGAAVSALMAVPVFLTGALITLGVVVAGAVAALWAGEGGPLGWVAQWAGRWRGPASRLPALAGQFLAGTGVIRERARLPKAIVLTLAGWMCSASAMNCMLASLAAPAPWFAGSFAIVLINLAGILPAPPAGIGVYHYSAMIGVSPWLPDANRAFALVLLSHAASVAVVVTLGAVGLARTGLSLRGLRRIAEGASSERVL